MSSMSSGEAVGSAPAAPVAERFDLLDSLRGFALFGILLGNILNLSGYRFLSDARRAALPFSAADGPLEFLVRVFVEGKFYSLFSLLFGIGFAVLLVRSEAVGRSFRRFFSRRLSILLAIGLLHATLVWFGDILTLYALVGFALFLFYRRSDRTILTWSVVLFALPVVQYVAFFLLSGNQAPDPQAAAGQEAFFDAAVTRMATGSAFEVFTFNLQGLVFGRYPDLFFTGRPFKVLGTFLIGLYIGRHAIYAAPQQWRTLLRRVAVWGVIIGLPANVGMAILMERDVFYSLQPPGILQSLLYAIGVPSLALAYAAGFTLLWLRSREMLSYFSPAGRMALTNYLLQSTIFILIFTSYGGGYFGSVGVAAGLIIATLFFPLQVVLSTVWLRSFRFGPAEWLWRTLTYGKRQPMRRPRTATIIPAPLG
jgi:uncharacterized protein